MANERRNLLLVAVALVLLYVIFVAHGFSTLSIGGTVTSLSYVQIISNYPQLNGPAWLASITLNGKGQNLTSFGAQQLNSSYSQGTPVSITTQVTNYGYKLQYTATPTSLYYWKVQTLSIGSIAYSCPVGVSCVISTSNGVTTLTMVWANLGLTSPLAAGGPLSNIESLYVQTCDNDNGIAILLNQNTLAVGSGTYGAQYECIQISDQPLASVYADSTYTNQFNATVSVSNATSHYSTKINNIVTQGNVTNNVYVTLESYSNSGYNLNTQEIPNVAQITLSGQPHYGQFILVNPISIQSTLSASESANFEGYVGATPPTGPTTGTLYSNITLSNVNNYNQEATSYLYNPVNGTNPYASINIAQFAQNNPVAFLNLTSNPTFYANLQVIAKFQTLGIGIPVAKPVITSVSPNPITAGSATTVTATFNVQNQGSSAGSVYISGACNGSTFGPSASVNIGAGQTDPIVVSITSPINPNNKTSIYQCQANAYSGPETSSTFSFQMQVNPQCGPGTIYVNPNTCEPVTQTVTVTTVSPSGNGGGSGSTTTIAACRQGYAYSNGACVANTTCAVGYTLNTSSNQCIANTQATNYTLLYIIIAIIVIVVIALLLNSFGHSKSGGK